MTDLELAQAVSEIEDRYILQGGKKKKRVKKTLLLLAAMIGIPTLLGFHRSYPLQYRVGPYVARVMQTTTPEGYQQSSSSLSSSMEMETFYRVENGEIFFTHDGSDRNITEFCSVNDCYLYDNVDFWGNGYIVAVGGTAENMGEQIMFFSGGQHTASSSTTSSGQERDPYYDGFYSFWMEHQWEAALRYEVEIRSIWYTQYYSEQDKWDNVDSQKPYAPYVITVEKA